MRQAERFYDAHAAQYEPKFDKPVVRRIKRLEEKQVLEFLFEHLPPAGRLLELGCGTGLFTLPVAERGYDLTAVDIASGMLDETRRKLERRGMASVTVVKADVEALPPMGGFDAVYGIGLLEYLDSPAQFIRQVAGLLEPGGVACFTGPTLSLNGLIYRTVSWLRKGMRMQLFSSRRLRTLFTDAGLDFIAARDVGFSLTLNRPLTRVAAGRKPVHAPPATPRELSEE